MHTFKFAACGIFVAFVSACGGSDSATTAQTETTPSASIPQYLTLDAMRSNQCDVTSPDLSARFLVHDTDGKILTEYQTDPDGHLSIEWTNESQHLTQITYNEPNNTDSGVIVSTYLNAPANDLGYLAHYIDNDIGCECNEIEIDIRELQDNGDFQFLDFTTNKSTMSVTLSPYTQYSPTKVSWCANSMTDLSLVSPAGFRMKAANILFEKIDVQELNLSDFSDGIVVNTAAPNESSFQVAYTGFYRFYNDSLLFAENSVINNRAVLIYPDLNLSSMLYTHDYTSVNLLDAHSNINLSSRQSIDSEGYTQPIALLPVNESFLLEIENIAMQKKLEANTIDFDFAAYDSDISSTTFKLYDGSQPYFESDNTWLIFAGREGVVPALNLPQNVQAKFDAIEHKKISISLRKVNRYFSWEEWRAQFATESRSVNPANELIYQQSHSIKIDFDLTSTNE
ncbi:hypothetical protein [Shewanella surugensis]|uniref:Lipoprotein n=1 Tax=Shewanella surugensis TaxID=212020 RepID=A0ABT0LHD6_9GAMM|nr:hypothetical protein [Shewanella surugensis]MCL1127118.1 hypothetical protein [Shewanella surugensis]